MQLLNGFGDQQMVGGDDGERVDFGAQRGDVLGHHLGGLALEVLDHRFAADGGARLGGVHQRIGKPLVEDGVGSLEQETERLRRLDLADALADHPGGVIIERFGRFEDLLGRCPHARCCGRSAPGRQSTGCGRKHEPRLPSSSGWPFFLTSLCHSPGRI